MKITIHDQRKIHEIQKEFSQKFPNLKLDFFTIPDKAKKASHNKLLVHPSKSIGECRAIHSKGDLTILPEMTVSDLEKGFRDAFGLSTKVFRKVGKDWLETATSVLTLEKQNAIVSEMNSEDTLEIV